MTLIEFHADVTRVANALERIVFLLEKLVIPPLPADVSVMKATLDDLHIITPEDAARTAAEQMRFAEIHKVVPGSEAFDSALLAWEAEQRELHGEAWNPPAWAEVFATAAGGGRAAREPAGAASEHSQP